MRLQLALRCHAKYQKVRVTHYQFSNTHWNSRNISHHLQGIWNNTDFGLDLDHLQKTIIAMQDNELESVNPPDIKIITTKNFASVIIVQIIVWTFIGIMVFLLPILSLIKAHFRAQEMEAHYMTIQGSDRETVHFRAPRQGNDREEVGPPPLPRLPRQPTRLAAW